MAEGAFAEYETVQIIQYLIEIEVNDRMFGRVTVEAGITKSQT